MEFELQEQKLKESISQREKEVAPLQTEWEKTKEELAPPAPPDARAAAAPAPS